jgi:GH24 family phage-related lysozyme (muramidase)
MAIQRQEIQLPQTGVEGPSQLQVQDSFGVSEVAPNPNRELLSTLSKFGDKVAAGELKKEAQANYAAGQALRAAGEELTGKEPAPSRKGYKALDAKLRAQQWLADQKEGVDNGDNTLDPGVYTEVLSDRFKDLLTGDAETDQILTASMGTYAAELGRYQASANYKKRTSDGVAQATADVRNHLLEINNSKNKGDVKGEAAARAALNSALTLPTVQNSTLRKQLSADLAVMGLELGDPAVLNYARENEVEFTPEQERKLASATAAYNTKQARKLDLKYQNDTADFEANVAGAKSVEEFRELAAVYQEAWPERATNKYMIAQEASFRRHLAIGAKNKLFKEEMRQGNIGKLGITDKQIQATYESIRAEVLADQTLKPEEAQAELLNVWKSNGVVINSVKTELTSGLAVPLKDGVLHPNFKPAFEKTLEHYKVAPDLTLKHLPEAQRKLFLDARAATTYGGLALGDAVSALEEHRVNRKALTRDEREDFSEGISDAVDSVLGKGFFNWEHGLTTTLQNEAEVSTRLTALANIALNQGMQDPEAAVEFARTKILETHEQVGNSLVFNDGKPITERMGIPSDRLEDAMDYFYTAVEAERPGFDRENSVLLGDPKDDSLLVGALNEYGVITEVYPANMPAIGRNFSAEVLQPEYNQYLLEEAASVQHAQDTQALIQESKDLLGWTQEDAEAAVTNTVGRLVTEQRVKSAKQNKADMDLAQRYGIESKEELGDLKMMQSAFSPGNTLTKEQIDLLNDGKLDEYMRTLGQVPGTPDAPEQVTNDLIVRREGNVSSSYEDTEGNLTAGIGHRLTPAEQTKYPEGTEIPQSVRDKWFREDIKKANEAAEKQLTEAGITNPAAKQVFESVNFQLGTGWTRKFPGTWKLIKQGKYKEAAQEVQLNSAGTGPSLWKRQTPTRVQDFVDLLNTL